MSAYTQKDFEVIEAAVLESPRGRWFLAEFTRRNRAADTLMLLEAIRKLERGVAGHSAHQVSDELAAELQSLSDAIGSTLAGDAEVTEDDVRDVIEQLSGVKRQIDGLLADRSGDNVELTAENLKFFRADEDLFEARLAPSTPLAAVGEDEARAGPARTQPAQPEASAAKGDPKDRIVFIHRAASSQSSIPLLDEADDPVPAGQSQPAS